MQKWQHERILSQAEKLQQTSLAYVTSEQRECSTNLVNENEARIHDVNLWFKNKLAIHVIESKLFFNLKNSIWRSICSEYV